MKRSINEIQSMVLKAARGAGVPLGLCEDLSRAVPFLIKNKVLDQVSHLIDAGCNEAQAAIDSAILGQRPPLPSGIPVPVIVGIAASQGLNLEYENNTMRLTSSPPMTPANTYVPASDASRLAGAGAGLTDND